MEKFSLNSGPGDLERELEIQGRLAERAEAAEPLRENGKAGNGQSRTVSQAHSSNPRMLVVLDILCLIVGVCVSVVTLVYQFPVIFLRSSRLSVSSRCFNQTMVAFVLKF
ncbi:hypothetical protein Baya_14345 [Bagarius yarrelli]|uniref:Uncharacterized protein n=1 Tax=Bagarius yarrelli TaxID=175774 RepID=A0A556V8Y0_BAGYA|nr:hypothetical protein Baya_14345 [Bagarius yarrelli]